MLDDDSIFDLTSNDPSNDPEDDMDDIQDTSQPEADNVSIKLAQTSIEQAWDLK